MNMITPHAAKMLRLRIRAGFADLRSDIVHIRKLRDTGRILDEEYAAGLTAGIWSKHRYLQEDMKLLRTVRIVKFSNLSTAAALRMTGHHARR